jgi:hypothetical protein
VCANPTGKAASSATRFINCHDGTVVDTTTGLMWELKDTKCASGDLHCVGTTYTWTSSGTKRDGTLFTTFLAGLNEDSVNFNSSGNSVDSENPGTGCFANHCDWRIPNIAELQTIRDINLTTAPDCQVGKKGGGVSPCIDQAAFDPPGYGTELGFYFSSSSFRDSPPGSLGNPDSVVWGIYFNNGYIGLGPNSVPNYARAVRGGG